MSRKMVGKSELISSPEELDEKVSQSIETRKQEKGTVIVMLDPKVRTQRLSVSVLGKTVVLRPGREYPFPKKVAEELLKIQSKLTGQSYCIRKE